jgi:hypothetical protein
MTTPEVFGGNNHDEKSGNVIPGGPLDFEYPAGGSRSTQEPIHLWNYHSNRIGVLPVPIAS